MSDFFNGWRRKIGCVTLMMALVFTGGWVRSTFMFDGIEVVSIKSKYLISSIRGQIRWFSAHSDQARVQKQEIRFPSAELKASDKPERPTTRNQSSVIVGDFYLISETEAWGHYSDLVQTPGPRVQVSEIMAQAPYWSITIPLTLLSAFLLLSKPRKTTPKKISEPIPAEGT